MSPSPSFMLVVETAAAFRNWLSETGVENHAEPQIANPLAELAAVIDGELPDPAEYIVISASATAVSLTDHRLSSLKSVHRRSRSQKTQHYRMTGLPLTTPTVTSADLTTCGTAYPTSRTLSKTTRRQHRSIRHRRQQRPIHQENGTGCRFDILPPLSARCVATSES